MKKYKGLRWIGILARADDLIRYSQLGNSCGSYQRASIVKVLKRTNSSLEENYW
jgi:hypothetical protein